VSRLGAKRSSQTQGERERKSPGGCNGENGKMCRALTGGNALLRKMMPECSVTWQSGAGKPWGGGGRVRFCLLVEGEAGMWAVTQAGEPLVAGQQGIHWCPQGGSGKNEPLVLWGGPV
jgi:hypothetical protein